MLTHLRSTLGVLAVLVTATPPRAGAQDSTIRMVPDVGAHRSMVTQVAPYVGSLAAAVLADHGFRAVLQDHRGGIGDGLAGFGNGFGNPLIMAPIVVAGFVAGKLARSDGLAQASFHAGRAMLVAGALTQVFKISIGRARPLVSNNDVDTFQPFSFNDGHNSFPSGHAAVAFSIAAGLEPDVKSRWGKRLLYAAATTTAFARLNNDKHWLSDVVGGAMLGTLTAKALAHGRAKVLAVPGGMGLSIAF